MSAVASQTKISTSPDVVQKTLPPPVTNGSSTTITRVRSQVSAAALDSEPMAKEGYVCPDFAIENDKGVFLNLNKLQSPESFLGFVNDVFTHGYYFTDLQYPTLMAAMYNFSKIVEYRQEKTTAGKQPIVKIASSIKKFDEKRVLLYKKPVFSREGKKVGYPFSFEDSRNGLPTEEKINIDEFTAVMWTSGIRFGLDIDKIKQVIQEEKSGPLCVIAQEKNCIPWVASKIEPVISFDVDRGIKGGHGTEQVDIRRHERSHIEVKKDTPLYKKIPQVDGKLGRTISGKPIDPPSLPDFPIEFYKGEGVRVEIVDGFEYLVADRDGYPREEKRDILRAGKITDRINRIHIDTEIVFERIDKSTWSVTTSGDMLCKNNIYDDIGVKDVPGKEDEIGGKNITAEKDVEANIYASENIIIRGDVFGSTVSGGDLSSENRKVSLVQKWRIVSDTESVRIGWRANNAYLEAKNGTVRVSDVTNSIIMAKRVEITGDVFNCTIIADEVAVRGKTIGCQIISGKIMSIQESAKSRHHENTLSLFSMDLKDSIQEKQNLLNKEETGAEKIENDIHTTLVSRSLSAEKSAEGKRKWLHMMVVLMEVFTDQGKLKQEKYQHYIPHIQKNGTVLRTLNQNDSWKKLREHYLSIKQLSEEITQETTAMEWTQKDLHIEIGDIQCHTHVQWIKFTQNKQLLDLAAEELDAITASLNKPNTTVPYRLEKIPSPPKWSFEWRPV